MLQFTTPYPYEYYHVAQEGINDRHWGSAYRVWQTVASACLHTPKLVPDSRGVAYKATVA